VAEQDRSLDELVEKVTPADEDLLYLVDPAAPAGTGDRKVKVGSLPQPTVIDDHGALLGLAEDDHPQYLTEGRGDARYDAQGTAQGLVDAHEAAPDPHPAYLTSAEGDAAYEPLGASQTLLDAHEAATDPHAAAGYLQSVVAGANVTVDDTDPRNPVVSATASGGGGGSVTVSGTPPADPAVGDLWYENVEDGRLFIWDGAQWVDASPAGEGGGTPAQTVVDLTVTTVDVTAEAGNHYRLDVSGMTADRNFILPAGVDLDEVSFELVTDAPADYELIVKGAIGVSGRLRNNDAVSAAEITRCFIRGEAMRWVHDGTDWVCTALDDGRIPCSLRADLTTSCDGEAVFTNTVPTAAPTPGAWTVIYDNAGLFAAASSTATVRRSGIMSASARFYSKDANSYSAKRLFGVIQNTTQTRNLMSAGTAQFAGLNLDVSAVAQNEVSAGDVLTVLYQTEEGNKGLLANATVITLQEIL
jgi:hypothetical protein